MSIRNMIIMVLLCLGLGTFWYVYDYKGEPERQEAKDREERVFPDLKVEDVVGLHWIEPEVGKDSERQLTLKDGLWMLQDGAKQVYAAQLESADIAKQLAELKRVSVIKEQPQKAEYADFGLDGAEVELTISSKGQNGEATLLIGAETPAGDARYMQVKGKAPILEVEGSFMDFLRNRAVDMREKTLLVVSPDKIAKIAYTEPGQSKIEMHKVPGATEAKEEAKEEAVSTSAEATWLLDSPQKCKADVGAVNDFLWQLHGLSSSKFIPDVEKGLLRNKLVTIEYTVEGGSNLHVEIWNDDLGQRNDGSLVIHRLDTDEYMTVSCPVEKNRLFGLTLDNFIDHHMFDLKVDDIDRMEVSVPARTVAGKAEAAQVLDARRDGDRWKVSKPATVITSENERDASLFEVAYTLTDMQWSKKDKQGGGKVDSNSPTFVAYDKDGQVLARLSIGAKGEKGYPVQLEGSPALFWLEADPSVDWAHSIDSIIPDDMKAKTSPAPDAASPTPAAASPAPDAASPAPDAASPAPDAASPTPAAGVNAGK